MFATTAQRLILAGACALIAACGQDKSSRDLPSPDSIRAAGTLRVITRNAPTAYYIDRFERPAGPEYDLAQAYANALGVKLEIITRPTIDAVMDALANGDGDLAAAGLTRLDSRAERFDFGPAYRSVREQVVCRRDGDSRARERTQLPDVKLAVTAQSSYAQSLMALQQELPELHFEQIDTGTEQLLHRVWTGQIDCTVADSNLVALNRRYYPELVVEFDLADARELAWLLPKGATALRDDLRAWFGKTDAREELAAIEQRYYAPYQEFDFVDTRAFFRRLDERYDKYDHLFEAAAEEFGLDETILAAQAYQESHWDPHAKSPTGVRGMMMLTRTTAQELGVDNRLDPKQSIRGGAKYLARLQQRFDDDIDAVDRLYLTLAAYNIGRAHMHDAQTLARERGLDPHSWEDVRTILPLLADKSVYPSLKYGYARGHEPVRYVDRIRNYADLLERGPDDG